MAAAGKTLMAVGFVAALVSAGVSVYIAQDEIKAQREQAERDYLRSERRIVYADFQACREKISDAITAAVEMGGGGQAPPRRTPFPKEVGIALHDGMDCLDEAHIQLQLLAPAATADEADNVWNYYALRVQGFDQLQRALAEAPHDENKIGLLEYKWSPANDLEHPDPNYVDIGKLEGELLDRFRSDLGSSH